MTEIIRNHIGPRMSQSVIHNGVVYLAGQIGTAGAPAAQQTQDCLDNVDRLLAELGIDKTRILNVQIWISDMADFAEMNAVWDAWVPAGHAPARATGESKLATPAHKVEIMVIAAMP